jgi:hypothetical protein
MDIKLIDTLGFDKLNFTLKHYFKEQTIIKIDPEIVNKVYEKDTELFSKCIKFNDEEFKKKLKLW